MTTSDFRRIALSLEGAEEGSHMGSPDFRVGGRIFATLGSQSQGYGNLVLMSEQQAEFVAEQPDVFRADSRSVGKDGSDACSAVQGERGSAGWCSSRCMEPTD